MDLGNSEEFVVRWVAVQRLVAAFIGATVPDFHESEDLLQEVASAALRKFGGYDRTRPFAAWVLGIARNEVLNHRRKRATSKLVFSDELVAQLAQSFGEKVDEGDKVREALRECLKRVAGRSRLALDLRYVDDLKPNRIAQELTLSPGAARVLLNRARSAVRECIRRRLNLVELPRPS